MNRAEILRAVDEEIERLKKVRVILGGNEGRGFALVNQSSDGRIRRGPGQMSRESRDRIAAAQRARWARVKAGQKKK